MFACNKIEFRQFCLWLHYSVGCIGLYCSVSIDISNFFLILGIGYLSKFVSLNCNELF